MTARTATEVSTSTLYCFELSFDAVPGSLERVLGEFSKRDMVPVRLGTRPVALEGPGDCALGLEVWVDTRDAHTADVIAAKLQVMPHMRTVTLARVAGSVQAAA
ncbi:hypothetical protein [Futiania mangrovi]|uniref:Uncharacterized protein n=1 Tax=Futiania mangrovi TaxID=2959716 RepID=A0A9J6PC98_9PROT|nr:hypothetical protein [Futiania mangrovii]MCP1335408.1 hypothetical protein [Futiania mangrovii]